MCGDSYLNSLAQAVPLVPDGSEMNDSEDPLKRFRARARRERVDQFVKLMAALAGTVASMLGSLVQISGAIGAIDIRLLLTGAAIVGALLSLFSSLIIARGKNDSLKFLRQTIRQTYLDALDRSKLAMPSEGGVK